MLNENEIFGQEAQAEKPKEKGKAKTFNRTYSFEPSQAKECKYLVAFAKATDKYGEIVGKPTQALRMLNEGNADYTREALENGLNKICLAFVEGDLVEALPKAIGEISQALAQAQALPEGHEKKAKAIAYYEGLLKAKVTKAKAEAEALTEALKPFAEAPSPKAKPKA